MRWSHKELRKERDSQAARGTTSSYIKQTSELEHKQNYFSSINIPTPTHSLNTVTHYLQVVMPRWCGYDYKIS